MCFGPISIVSFYLACNRCENVPLRKARQVSILSRIRLTHVVPLSCVDCSEFSHNALSVETFGGPFRPKARYVGYLILWVSSALWAIYTKYLSIPWMF